ncbi:MAG: hypothetical protein ACERLG_00700 [Sedimentibacter sp.]
MDFEHLKQISQEYQRVTGGKELIGLTVPIGFPCGIKSWEQVEEVYKLCILKGITWEKLLKYKEPPSDALI